MDNDGATNIVGLEIEDHLQGADVDVLDVFTDRSEDDCPDVSDDKIECELGTLEGEGGDDDVAEITIVVEALEAGRIENTANLLLNDEEIAEDEVRTRVENNPTPSPSPTPSPTPGTGSNQYGDVDGDGDIDQDDELAGAEADLEALDNDITDGEGTTGDDFDDGESGVSASSGEDGAEASTPGAFAESGGDPDEQAPVAGPQGDVQDEIPTEGPLPETGGASIAAGTSLALVLFGLSLLALRLLTVWRGRRT